MSMSKAMLCAVAVLIWLVGGLLPAHADTDLGRFGWKLAPGCEILVLHINDKGRGVFPLQGYVDLTDCGDSDRHVPAEGVAHVTSTGVVNVGVSVLYPGIAVNLLITLDALPSGHWVDDLANNGTFSFVGSK